MTAIARRWPVWLYVPNLISWCRVLLLPVLIVDVREGRWGWAAALFIAAGISDGLDGLLARRLHQHSRFGEYLDPLADKLLLSTLFVVLSMAGVIPWLVTILLFTRDACILVTALLIYFRTGFRDFQPTLLGKANTTAAVALVSVALIARIWPADWLHVLERIGWAAVFLLSYASGIHYSFTCASRFHRSRALSGGVAFPNAPKVQGIPAER